MSEKTFQATVLKHFRARGLHCVKHNDSLTPGIPDLSVYSLRNYKTQWIELKFLPKWPMRGPVNLGFSDEQYYFLSKRNGLGLVKVSTDVLLLQFSQCANKCSENELKRHSLGWWLGRVDWDEVVRKVFL